MLYLVLSDSLTYSYSSCLVSAFLSLSVTTSPISPVAYHSCFLSRKGILYFFFLVFGCNNPTLYPSYFEQGALKFLPCLSVWYHHLLPPFSLLFILILFLEKLVLILTGILCPCLSLSTSSAEVVPLISKSTVRLAEATETALAFNLIFEVYCIICTKCSLCYLYIQAM